jgi:hypothetical protein
MTKKILVLTICTGILSWLFGCQEGQWILPPTSSSQDSSFPEFLVGTWQPDESRWVLTFEPDGRISKMRHFGGMEFDVAEGGLVEQWRNNAEAIYALGPCEARYNPDIRELSVTVVIEHYVVNFPNGSMEGNFHEYLTGPVSEDGVTWNATWTSTGEIIGAGSSSSGPKQLTFTKVDRTR